ncbi:MAG TPA: heme ABC exporter ATP-binding protein CcmA [Terriglobales bacterium]|nr:heme ABC exporter ATP-binding protein CcmA [Terriglobales bacterium]
MTDSSIRRAHGSHSEPAVVLERVSKLFGRFAALHDLSVDFAAGRLYALLGENGAGKTTLLRIIAGLSRPSRGTVQVLGSPDFRSVNARIGYMAHATLLYDELTAAENLDFFRELYRSRPTASIHELLEAVGLAHVDARQRVSHYSQGMKQRLALARAILASPDLLLLDEPFSNVDTKSIATMSALLGSLRDKGTTLIVITHQMEALAAVADEWITLHAGTIVRREDRTLGSQHPPSRFGAKP